MSPGSRGFSLVELVVAMAITIGVTAAVFAVVNPSSPALVVQGEGVDVQQRLRAAAESLGRDLRLSGAGGFAHGRPEPLSRVMAAVRPSLPSDEDGRFRNDAIELTFVPAEAAQATTATPLPARSGTVLLSAATACPGGSPPCGFAVGSRVLAYDHAGFHDLFTVAGVGGGSLQLLHDSPDSAHVYPVGSALVEVVHRAYALGRDASGVDRLVRDEGGASVPVADHVVGLSFELFGDPEPPRVMGPPPASGPPQTTYGPRPPPAGVSMGSFPPGENCVFTYSGGHVPRLPRLLPDDGSLVRLTQKVLENGPWCPDGIHPTRFDADLLRVRRILVRVRVEAAIDSLRGPAGVLFLRAGTAGSAARVVPDLEGVMQIAPGNLGALY